MLIMAMHFLFSVCSCPCVWRMDKRARNLIGCLRRTKDYAKKTSLWQRSLGTSAMVDCGGREKVSAPTLRRTVTRRKEEANRTGMDVCSRVFYWAGNDGVLCRASSLVDDDVYRKDRRDRKASNGVRQSRTSPSNSIPEGVLFGGGDSSSMRSRGEGAQDGAMRHVLLDCVSECFDSCLSAGSLPSVNRAHIRLQDQHRSPVVSKKYTIREVLEKEGPLVTGSALGSPSKSSMEAVRRSYFDVNSKKGKDLDWEDEVDDEDSALDMTKLREKLKKLVNYESIIVTHLI